MLRTPFRFLKSFVSLKFAPSCVHLPEIDAIGKDVRSTPENAVTAYVTPEVITLEEESALLKYTKTLFDPLPFNDGHIDGLIHHYKEFYRSFENIEKGLSASSSSNDKLVLSGIRKARALALHYLPHIPVDDRVHFLQLESQGFIRSHVDENRNSSGLIGGLCLGSSRVMTLTTSRFPGEKAELLLARRSFYAIIGRARYDWEHSVDWIEDDQDHVNRIKARSGCLSSNPVLFAGEEREYRTGTRTAIIFRGISPLALLQQRMHTPKQ